LYQGKYPFLSLTFGAENIVQAKKRLAHLRELKAEEEKRKAAIAAAAAEERARLEVNICFKKQFF
jgi:hypothetical protein